MSNEVNIAYDRINVGQSSFNLGVSKEDLERQREHVHQRLADIDAVEEVLTNSKYSEALDAFRSWQSSRSGNNCDFIEGYLAAAEKYAGEENDDSQKM